MNFGMGLVTWAPGMSLEALERQVIQNAFKFYKGNKSAMAQSLGVSVRTIEMKLVKYKEEEQEQQERDGEIRKRNAEFLTRSRGVCTNPTLASAPIAPKLHSHEESGEETDQGLYAQPTTATSAESAVSVPQRTEVQELLPAKTAGGGSNRRR